jgi:hypothetical protein
MPQNGRGAVISLLVTQQTRTPNVAKQHWVVFKGSLLGCSSKTQPNIAVNNGLIVTIVGCNVGL